MGIEAPPLRVKVYKGPNKVSLRLSIKSEIIIMISDFIPKKSVSAWHNGSVENDQHQKMINIVHSENDHHIYFGNNFEENDHHGKVKKWLCSTLSAHLY